LVDGITLSDGKGHERSRADPPFCIPTAALCWADSGARNRLICADA